ncbi:MAG TPA: hypothetical protein VGM93_09105 [Acidimicrobiales bacterium]|jgi:hypothetical protein
MPDFGPEPFGPLGDDDPADAWDASDTPETKLLVLARRLAWAATVLYLLHVDHQEANADVRERVLSALGDLTDTFGQL